ncbi:MAG: ABC transporter substrate-binding protein [Chloroflexota bacterium]
MCHTEFSPKAYAWVSTFLVATICLLEPGFASAGSPTDALQATGQKVRALLGDQQLKQPEHVAERHTQLMTLIRERFSCEEMSKRALGEEWARRSEPEQQEFTRLFQSLLTKSYAGKIEVYADEPVRYIAEEITNRYATVRAIMYAPKKDYVLDFQLMEKAGNWLVYDIVIDGISLMASYRGQFARVLGYSSYETLVERMREKAALPMHARAD